MWLPRITRCPHDDCRSKGFDRIEDEFLDNSVQELAMLGMQTLLVRGVPLRVLPSVDI